jgi:hypothetical protein
VQCLSWQDCQVIKTGNKIRLDKWKKGDMFYGIDW